MERGKEMKNKRGEKDGGGGGRNGGGGGGVTINIAFANTDRRCLIAFVWTLDRAPKKILLFSLFINHFGNIVTSDRHSVTEISYSPLQSF